MPLSCHGAPIGTNPPSPTCRFFAVAFLWNDPRMAEAAVRRRSHGEAPILFGTILFLASELMFFGGLFAAYFSLRAKTAPWPPADVRLDLLMPSIGTVLLVVSSFTFQASVWAAARGGLGSMRRWIGVTFLLGAAFLAIQVLDNAGLDFHVSSHAYGTMFFAMTGFHGLHVAAGLLLMLVVLGRSAQGAYRDGSVSGLEAVAYYWHFVDVVWIGLFSTLFLLR
jgi:cytochrome c oxidase subunit 3